jgi:hypothetical protein
MNSLTILTPTYNRAHLLPRLYESLLRQTNHDFEWLVIDDGSTDETEKLIKNYQSDGKIQIVYEKQENGGKHRALNRGMGQITTELTFIVDSDDYLPDNGVEIIFQYHEKYRERREKEHLCGYSFLRCHQDGSVNTAYFPEDEKIDTYLSVRINGNIGGDKAEVFYTDILKQYPFPEFDHEKFMPEDAVWMKMSGPYRMVHINQNIYICDYLEGGLTKTGRRMKIHSPKGMVLRSKVYLDCKEVCLKVKVKMMLLYIIYGHFAGYSNRALCKEVREKALYAICFLPAGILYLNWKRLDF